MSQLRDAFQFRMSGSGPYMFNAGALNTSGQAAVAGAAPFSGQIFTMPAAGTIGTLGKRVFDGPWDTTFDFNLVKDTKINERHSIQLRMDAQNFLNHPSFAFTGDQTVTSTTFGKITGTYANRRQIQFALYYRF
jgi:hypothetical protein